MIQLSRRSLIGSVASLLAAPAIVRARSLMPVKEIAPAAPSIVVSTTGTALSEFVTITGWNAHGELISEKVRIGETTKAYLTALESVVFDVSA